MSKYDMHGSLGIKRLTSSRKVEGRIVECLKQITEFQKNIVGLASKYKNRIFKR